MKKELYIILIGLIFIGCETSNKLEQEFENQLPKTDQILLEKIVNYYDNFIEIKYAGNSNQFFSQIESNKPIFNESNKQSYCELLKMFDESTLENKDKNIKYDSVYLSEKGNIITRRQAKDVVDEELEFDDDITILPPGRTIEEEMEEIKEKGYWRRISESSFDSALSKISKNKTEVQAYINRKETVGYINPKIIAFSTRKNEVDRDDYFIKRIIAIELFIRQIRMECGG